MTILDSHAHLTCPDFTDEELPALLLRAGEAGVAQIVNICTDAPSLQRGLELARHHHGVSLAGATTPHDVAALGESDFGLFAAAARKGDLVAVGETGLDYHYNHSPRSIQQKFLVEYCALALECDLPLIIHCRDAFADLVALIRAHYCKGGQPGPGVLHCFTGTLEEAKQVLELGWHLSFSGIATFKKSNSLRQVAAYVPLDRLLVETDAPYLAPQSRRGKRNEPSFIVETIACLGAVKGISSAYLADATARNARSLFRLP